MVCNNELSQTQPVCDSLSWNCRAGCDIVVVQSLSLTLYKPINRSTPGFPVLHYLLESAQTHVHWVSDAIQPSHSLSPPSSLALNFPQHQGLLFTLGGQNTGASALASVFPINIQGWFPLGLTGLVSLLSKGLSRVFSSTTIQKHQFFGAHPCYGLTLTSVHDYWKNNSFD